MNTNCYLSLSSQADTHTYRHIQYLHPHTWTQIVISACRPTKTHIHKDTDNTCTLTHEHKLVSQPIVSHRHTYIQTSTIPAHSHIIPTCHEKKRKTTYTSLVLKVLTAVAVKKNPHIINNRVTCLKCRIYRMYDEKNILQCIKYARRKNHFICDLLEQELLRVFRSSSGRSLVAWCTCTLPCRQNDSGSAHVHHAWSWSPVCVSSACVYVTTMGAWNHFWHIAQKLDD